MRKPNITFSIQDYNTLHTEEQIKMEGETTIKLKIIQQIYSLFTFLHISVHNIAMTTHLHVLHIQSSAKKRPCSEICGTPIFRSSDAL